MKDNKPYMDSNTKSYTIDIHAYASSECNGYQCVEGPCIYDYWVCDDYVDCPYGEDEEGCPTTQAPVETEAPGRLIILYVYVSRNCYIYGFD